MLMDILAFQLVAIDFSKVYLMLHVSFKEALGSSADCGKQARCALSKDVATHSSLCSPQRKEGGNCKQVWKVEGTVYAKALRLDIASGH